MHKMHKICNCSLAELPKDRSARHTCSHRWEEAGSLRSRQTPARRPTSCTQAHNALQVSVEVLAGTTSLSPWLKEKARKTTKQLAVWCSQGRTADCTRGLDSDWWSWRMESATVPCRLPVRVLMLGVTWDSEIQLTWNFFNLLSNLVGICSFNSLQNFVTHFSTSA